MIDINAILSQDNPSDIIASLKERTTSPVDWSKLVTEYDPQLHKIATDTTGRKDKIHSDGSKDEAARIYLGLENLLVKRMTEFTFSIPVKRVYTNSQANEDEISKVIERIYSIAHIDNENRKRGLAYYASCEILTLWYVKKGPHNLYGFPCKYKLKCKTFSPMDWVTLFPLLDERDEMYAMSLEYRKKIRDEWVTFFETFTSGNHYLWQHYPNSEWEQVVRDDEMPIGKIPAIYLYRPHPVWHGLTHLREDLEYSLSRNSDIVAYNSAPILKVAGSLQGVENKGETRRIYRVTEGGDVAYVSWAQSVAALQYHADMLLNLFWSQAQIPDISFEKMRSLGNIGYDARKTLLTDAHLKIGDESGAWIEFFERESNVIKAFLKRLHIGFDEAAIDNLQIEHIITPYIQEDESLTIDKWLKASGGKPLVSHLDAIRNAGLTEDSEGTYHTILQELHEEQNNTY